MERLENVRKRIDLKLVKTYEQAKKYIKRPNFTYLKRFSENLCAIHLEKTKVYLNKPIYVGFSVLELSKLHMYKFYYDKLKPKFESGINILYCDTDAFVLHIKTGNLMKDIQDMKSEFDFSDYPKEHTLQDNSNKKVVGKFKDELNGSVMSEFISLRSKMYAFKVAEKEKKICKGISRVAIENELKFEDYYNCLFNNKSKDILNRRFVSINHQIYTQNVMKKGLSTSDDKRFYINEVESVPFGYFDK
jgi:hypothetical protein